MTQFYALRRTVETCLIGLDDARAGPQTRLSQSAATEPPADFTLGTQGNLSLSSLRSQGGSFLERTITLSIQTKVFKPGDKVESSGIYRVTHDREHAKPHEVTCVFGKPFPPCNGCAHPRFELVRAAIHISSNEHFKN